MLDTQYEWKFAMGFKVVWAMLWLLICVLGLWFGVRWMKRKSEVSVC